MKFIVRMRLKNGEVKEECFEYLKPAAQFYFKEEPRFHYGKAGSIELAKEETVFSCS